MGFFRFFAIFDWGFALGGGSYLIGGLGCDGWGWGVRGTSGFIM